MLENKDLIQAVKRFENQPVYIKLINELWPQVKDFDFRKGNELRIQKPMRAYHEIIKLEASEEGTQEYYIHLIKLTTNYSHRAIRKVLGEWGLTVSNKFYIDEKLVIRKNKKNRKKGTRKNQN